MLPHPVLAADIGGTNCRVAIVDAPGDRPRVLKRLSTRDAATPEAALGGVIAEAGLAPQSAVLAVAGPVFGRRAELTNAGWAFEGGRLLAALGLKQGLLVNDFEALALCLPILGADDLTAIGMASVEPGPGEGGARLVLGPGTGFGAAALIGAEGRYVIAPSEAGHMELGPVEDDEFAIWSDIEPVDGRITIESVLSGSGLARLDAAIRIIHGGRPVHGDGAAVQMAAAAGEARALDAVRLFGRFLARAAGDLALAYKATGGVFIAGGITPKLLPMLDTGAMRKVFEAKAPMGELMRQTPLSVITGPDPAERGLARLALDPAAYGMAGRLWA
jgi:glucokinase